jgi:uncharacterized protein (TIGR02145 family)
MRNEVKLLLDSIIQAILQKHKYENIIILKVIYTSAYIINYFVDNGVISKSEKNECIDYIANYMYYEYASEMIVDVKHGWVLIMKGIISYNYSENIAPYIGLIIVVDGEKQISNTSNFQNQLSRKINSSETKITEIEENFVTDIDGNIYKTVRIGNRVWMAENLRTTRCNNGTELSIFKFNKHWPNINIPSYSWYNNDIKYKETFGALYNWYAINSNVLAPKGWHIATNDEWSELVDFLVFESRTIKSVDDLGKALATTKGWDESTNLNAIGNNPSTNNKTGFSAIASGFRDFKGSFENAGKDCNWWTATEENSFGSDFAWSRHLDYNKKKLESSSHCNKLEGFSVRCVKDN